MKEEKQVFKFVVYNLYCCQQRLLMPLEQLSFGRSSEIIFSYYFLPLISLRSLAESIHRWPQFVSFDILIKATKAQVTRFRGEDEANKNMPGGAILTYYHRDISP